MEARAALATIVVVVFYIASCSSPVSGVHCNTLETTTDRCRTASFIRVYKGPHYAYIGKNGRQQVVDVSLREQVYWDCGSDRERTAWGGQANRLLVTFHSNGVILWVIQRCY